MTSTARYDAIGVGYAVRRQEDPRLRALIHTALGDARSVVNVGAGAGSYEPRDRHVVAIEPSDVMAAQRPPELAPAIRASAGALPLRDDAVDAAMAVLTVHHWGSERERGVRELRRVARGPVVLVAFDAEIHGRMWLPDDYLPEVAEHDRRTAPSIATLATWLAAGDGAGSRVGPGSGAEVEITTVPVPADTPDHTFMAFWAHPERALDPDARAATSGWAVQPPEVLERAVAALRADLASGAWEARHGELRERDELDCGLRLIVARPS